MATCFDLFSANVRISSVFLVFRGFGKMKKMLEKTIKIKTMLIIKIKRVWHE